MIDTSSMGSSSSLVLWGLGTNLLPTSRESPVQFTLWTFTKCSWYSQLGTVSSGSSRKQTQMEIGVQEVYCEEGRGGSRTRLGEPQAVLQSWQSLGQPHGEVVSSLKSPVTISMVALGGSFSIRYHLWSGITPLTKVICISFIPRKSFLSP